MNTDNETTFTPDRVSRIRITLHHFHDGVYVKSERPYTYDQVSGTRVVSRLVDDLSPDWEDDETPGEMPKVDTG